MAGPWEAFQPAATPVAPQAGPWTQFQTPATNEPSRADLARERLTALAADTRAADNLYASQLSNFRQQFPEYSNVPDRQIVDSVWQTYYSDQMPREEFDAYLTRPTVPIGIQGQAEPTGFDQALMAGEQRAASQQQQDERAARPWNQKVGDRTRELLQGLTFGTSDEMLAYLSGVVSALSGGDFEQAMNRRLEWERSQSAAFQQENPVVATGLQIAGSLPTAAGAARVLTGGAPSMAVNPAARLVGGAAAAGAGGAFYGFSTGEGGLPGEDGTLAGRIANAEQMVLPSAGLGFAAPIVAPLVARGTVQMYNMVRYPLRGVTVPAPGVNPAQNIAAAGEFGVDLTRGQATRNVTQQAAEQSMLNAARGDYAQRVMQDAMNSQNDAIRTAAMEIGQQLSGPLGTTVTARQAGEMAIEGVRNIATNLQTSAQRGYVTAEMLNPTISRESAAFIPQNVASRVANGDFRLDSQLHPTAFAAMRELDALQSFAESGANAVPLTEIMRVQRVLNNMSGTNPADSAALNIVRRAYRNSVDDLFNEQMFSGDPIALTAWREANQQYSQYLSMTRPQTGDDAGRVLASMIERNVTPEEVANWLYGSSMASRPQRAVRVADLLKNTLGETSDEWNAIRSAAWSNLITQVSGDMDLLPAQRVINNISGFLNGRGQSLATTLFTGQERDLMQRFANMMRLVLPDAAATNPSRSGFTVSRMFASLTKRAFPFIGFSMGGWPGALAALVTQPASRQIGAWISTRRALNPNAAQPLFADPATAGRALTAVLDTANIALTPQLTQ